MPNAWPNAMRQLLRPSIRLLGCETQELLVQEADLIGAWTELLEHDGTDVENEKGNLEDEMEEHEIKRERAQLTDYTSKSL